MSEQKTISLEVKVTVEEMKHIGEYCKKRGLNFSEWLRELALREIEREEKKKNEEDLSSWVFII